MKINRARAAKTRLRGSLERPAMFCAAVGVVLTGALISGGVSSGSVVSAKTKTQPVPPAVAKQLAQYEKVISWSPPGGAFKAKAASGKVVFWLGQDTEVPFIQSVESAFKEALGRSGVRMIACDGKGNPVDENGCLKEAISLHPAAIEDDGVNGPLIASELKAAAQAHIPVVLGTTVDATLPVPTGFAAMTSQPFVKGGSLMADWIIANSGGHAHVLVLNTPDVLGANETLQSFTSTLTKYCPGCSTVVRGVTIPNWSTQLGSATTTALTNNPDITYVVPVFDPMTGFVDPAIQQSHLGSKISVVTMNGSLEQLQNIKTHNLIYADAGDDIPAIGYVEADQMLRVVLGLKPVQHYLAPIRMFTRDNVAGLAINTTTFANGAIYGPPSVLINAYLRHWHLRP